MYKSLRHRLEEEEDNALIHKINSITDIKKATGIVAGFAYEFPLTVMLATLLSTQFLKRKAKAAMKDIGRRLDAIKARGWDDAGEGNGQSRR